MFNVYSRGKHFRDPIFAVDWQTTRIKIITHIMFAGEREGLGTRLDWAACIIEILHSNVWGNKISRPT